MRTIFAVLGLSLWLTVGARASERLAPAWHPAMFAMIESWISDVESPVVTELNLDAVQRNRNQFDRDELRQEGEWITCRVPEGGFKRFRVIESRGNHYKVQYQDNGGGTLTTNSVISFTLEKREILVNGKPKVVNTLRVNSYSR